MNWFIGLRVDCTGWYPDRVPPPPPGFRAFHPEDLHLTIAFLGNVGEERALSAWNALEWAQAPATASLGKLVAMGAPRRYSALSFLLTDGREAIEDAMGRARGPCFAAAGVRIDERPAKAHVTIARPGRAASPASRKLGLDWAASIDLQGTPIAVDRLALFRWNEDRKVKLFRAAETRPVLG